ncbi:MAG: hypothetical protein AAFP15_15980 [Bacteroidota bacterium]
MAKSNYLEEQLLAWVSGTDMPTAPAAVYVALSTADPTEDGSGIAEPGAPDGYARAAATFGAAAQGANAATISNTAAVGFGPTSASWGTLTHFAVFDAPTGGNMLYHAALTASETPGIGDSLSFAVGQLTLSES